MFSIKMRADDGEVEKFGAEDVAGDALNVRYGDFVDAFQYLL